MSTFFGGETLVGAAVVSGLTSASGVTTFYTVPAGVYAKIKITNMASASNNRLNVAGNTYPDNAQSADPSIEYIIGAGASVSVTALGTPVTYYLFIREFAVP